MHIGLPLGLSPIDFLIFSYFMFQTPRHCCSPANDLRAVRIAECPEELDYEGVVNLSVATFGAS